VSQQIREPEKQSGIHIHVEELLEASQLKTWGGGVNSRRLFATSYSTNLMFSVSNGLGEECTNHSSQITRAKKLCTEEQNNCGSSVWNSLGVTTLALRTLWRVLDVWKICALLVQALHAICLVAGNTSSIVGLFMEMHSSVCTVAGTPSNVLQNLIRMHYSFCRDN